jgi:hypothetical protein
MPANRLSNAWLVLSSGVPLVHAGTGVSESRAAALDATSHRPPSHTSATASRLQRCVGTTLADQSVISCQTSTCALCGA